MTLLEQVSLPTSKDKGDSIKILNLCVSDSGAGAYSLSHALNKLPGVSSINLRTSNSYVNYPTMAEARFYGKEGCKKIVEAADVVIFHSAVRPFFDAFNLDRDVIKKKRKFVYFHGSECRNYGDKVIKDAKDVMGDCEVLLSTPDLFSFVPDGHWLPVARDFQAIKAVYGISETDKAVLDRWAPLEKKTVLGHVITRPDLKGTALFYKVITEVLETMENVEFLKIEAEKWDSCLRLMPLIDVLYDQFMLGCYGMVSVEASIFGAAVFCKLKPEVAVIIEKESGLPQPFIQWIDEDELRTQSFMLAQEPKLQRKFGAMVHDYCEKMHDDINVATRFMRILERT